MTIENAILILKKKYALFLLITIISFAFFFRVYKIAEVPLGFFADEASIGYNAYSILQTGDDEYGKTFPFFFEAFGEYKNPVQMYSTIPFIFLLGLNETSTRLPSVFWGIASILALYLLTKTIFHKNQYREVIALVAAFFLAISPWHFHLSRVALEGLMAYLFFTEIGLYFFLRTKHKTHLFLSILFFALAIYSYFPARIFIPLFFLSLLVIYPTSLFSPFRYKKLLIATLIIGITALPLIDSLLNTSGIKRWEQVSIFSVKENPYDAWSQIISNYALHFSPNFLFLKGDSGMIGQSLTRHSVRGFGELYFLQLPFLLVGLIILARQKDKRIFFVLLSWFLLYPLGSVFTSDPTPQATRSVIGVIPFQILTAFGLVTSIVLLKDKKVRALITSFIAGIAVISFFFFTQQYFTKYSSYSSDFWGWQYGPSPILSYFLRHHKEYDDLFMSGEFNGGYIFLKFYDPTNTCKGKCRLGDFHREPWIVNPKRQQLFSLSPDYLKKSPLREHFKTLQNIYYPSGAVAFKIGVIVQ